MGTYIATPTVIYNTYYSNPGYSDGLKQGMVYTSESKSVTPYNAWRSLCWFDGAAISAALTGQRVTKVGLNAKSSGNQLESPGATAIRLYRTNLSYDAAKAGKNSADTVRFTDGMTYLNPYNSYFLEYGETEPVALGATVTDAAFMDGQAARDLVSALISGYALGNFTLPSGSTYTGRSLNRYMSSITLTITYELDDTDVTPPLSASVTTPKVSFGGSGTITFSGAGAPSPATNPITGYALRYAESADGQTYGAWSDAFVTAMTQTEGELTAPIGAAGTWRKYQIATVGSLNTSSYKDVAGTVRVYSAPSAPGVAYALECCLLIVTATVGASLTDEAQYLCAATDSGEASRMDILPQDGGARTLYFPLSEGAHTITLAVSDVYGVMGAGSQITVTAQEKPVGDSYMIFKGLSSAALGMIMTSFPPPVCGKERVSSETLIGRAGDKSVRQGTDVYDAYDLTAVLCLDNDSLLPYARAWLSGQGALALGPEPGYLMDAEAISALSMERVSSGGGQLISVTFHVQPYRYKADEANEAIAFVRPGSLINAGDMVCYPSVAIYGSGDVTLTIGAQSMTVSGIDGHVTIDCDKLAILSGDGAVLDTAAGDYFALQKGASSVSWTGSVEKIAVKRRQRYR